MVRIRTEKESNYKAIYLNGNTLRLKLDSTKEMLQPKYPEFYDVAINDLCYGNCPYCYVSATNKGKNFSNVIDKIKFIFGNMSENERPFQVAIGGAGEPTAHPDFVETLKTFYGLGVAPNYTTNGMHVTDKVLEGTSHYSEGVAISCHPHLEKIWRKGVEQYQKIKTKLNLHIIVSDEKSFDNFVNIFNDYESVVDHFVLLPYMSVGRAKEKDTKFDKLFELFNCFTKDQQSKLGFGAHFYNYLQTNENAKKLNISLYEPEMFSAYVILNDPVTFHPSSYSSEKINIPRR